MLLLIQSSHQTAELKRDNLVRNLHNHVDVVLYHPYLLSHVLARPRGRYRQQQTTVIHQDNQYLLTDQSAPVLHPMDSRSLLANLCHNQDLGVAYLPLQIGSRSSRRSRSRSSSSSSPKVLAQPHRAQRAKN